MPETQNISRFLAQGAALLHGESGMVYVGTIPIGRLTAWRVTTSPATGLLVLWGEGHFRRYWTSRRPSSIVATLTPAPAKPTLRKPRPKTPPPQRFRGTCLELSIGRITVNLGTLEPL